MYNTKTYTKECAYLLIFNNNNLTLQNFNSFSDEKKHIFIKKTSVEANVNVAPVFTQHFVRNFSQFAIL